MNQIRISKRHRPASWRPEPLPAHPRDRDIVRAKQLVGRSRRPAAPPSPMSAKTTAAA